MSLKEYLKCVFLRTHRFKQSVQKPGMETCTFCHKRRPTIRKAI